MSLTSTQKNALRIFTHGGDLEEFDLSPVVSNLRRSIEGAARRGAVVLEKQRGGGYHATLTDFGREALREEA